MLINYPADNKTQRCREYIQALEEERRKIQVFSRELPLCLELVTQAIDSYKHQLSGTTTTEYNLNGQSECSEQTTSGGPVLEEFIPMKRTEEDEEEEEEDYEEQSHKSNHHDDDYVNNNEFNSNNNNLKKSDWLRSVQLWNQSPDPTPKEEESAKKVKRNGSGGAFHPFKKEKSVGVATTAAQPPTAAAAASSSGDTGGSKKENHSQRKQRRCWSPELHRRFLQALQHLGGPHVATPKQIRDLMKVDGLTNDEVKSHLQKYRLHSRRPSPTNHNNSSSQQSGPQFVVVGGIWMPPPEYATAVAAATEATTKSNKNKGIYAPVASLPSANFQDPSASNKRLSHSHEHERSNDGVHSNSPATSSSTHTTTASPVY